ncbi:MAG: hypothetical protein HYX53_11995 [Chloroflexi bacterium]|nr:hypothetical protein [Chloroflexota bacterium]
MRRILLAMAAMAAFAGAYGWPASMARAEATIESSTVENQYPQKLNFKVTLSAPSEITDVTLSFSVIGRGTSALAKPDSLTPAKNMTVTVGVPTNTGASYIPVGSDFVYRWEITTADGQKTVGPEAKFLFLPPGQDWKSVSNDIMAVWYYGDREALANAYLKAGAETYDKIATKLLNITLTQVPVKVILFADEKSLETARAGGPSSFDASVTNCGVKVANDVVMVIPVACGSGDRTDTLRHEFTHIINEAAGFGALSKIPSWLDEGTAVYGQTSPGDGYLGAYATAARGGKLIAINLMASPPNDASKVNLFYGQAYAMAKYLVDKGGPAKYAELFSTVKGGARLDDALKKVYGFDSAGFEKEFIAASGGAPAATVAPTRAQSSQNTPAATSRPSSTQPTPRPPTATGAASSNDGSRFDKTTIAIFGSAVVFALLAIGAFLYSMILQNNRAAAAAAGPGSSTIAPETQPRPQAPSAESEPVSPSSPPDAPAPPDDDWGAPR